MVPATTHPLNISPANIGSPLLQTREVRHHSLPRTPLRDLDTGAYRVRSPPREGEDLDEPVSDDRY